MAFENRQQGKTNKYTITESIKVDEKDGTPWAVGERKYVPLDFGDFAEQMRMLAKDGTLPTDKAITINFVLNVQQNAPGANGTMNIENIQVLNADDLALVINKNKNA